MGFPVSAKDHGSLVARREPGGWILRGHFDLEHFFVVPPEQAPAHTWGSKSPLWAYVNSPLFMLRGNRQSGMDEG